jgi:hypothetical protein
VRPLLLKTAVTDIPQSIEKHGTSQGVTSLPLIQSGMYPAAELDTLQPIQNEQRALDTPQFAQGDRQAILTWLAAKLPQHE